MAEPLKNLFNAEVIEVIATHLAAASPVFDRAGFIKSASDNLDALEMSARADQISRALNDALPMPYPDALACLLSVLHPNTTAELGDLKSDDEGLAGWPIWPLSSFVARNGLEHPEESVSALREMTMRFSAEFAIRSFLRDYPQETVSQMKEWTKDDNFHVRRLASEGTRPLLPWGIKLHRFVDDPAPVIEILEMLKDDPSDYVRRSVANNLNDISKDHPDLVSGIAARWLESPVPGREKMVKHACRTLIKKGHSDTLRAFGYETPAISDVELVIPDTITLGGALPISLRFSSDTEQNLLIDYCLYFLRANGSLSPKVFKWTERRAGAGETVTLEKSHAYRAVTTRKDYAGAQVVAIQINGVSVATRPFTLQLSG